MKIILLEKVLKVNNLTTSHMFVCLILQIGNQGQVYNVSHTKVLCTALDGIECAGAREFLRGEEPCIK